MIGNKIGHRLDPYLEKAYEKLIGHRGNPNALSLLGVLAILGASYLLITDRWIGAGLMVILSGFFDLLDGAIARKFNKMTPFGGFLDSVLDRYSDLFLFLALVIYYLKNNDSTLVIVTGFASIGTALIPYARARAEAVRIPCSVGLMERAERMILLSAGLLFRWMEPILWILAIFTHTTVLQRIYYVWKKLKQS
jgi:CDP-diacylglycerol--glycerol-3-phosphate 3-phosphatidyltransferase